MDDPEATRGSHATRGSSGISLLYCISLSREISVVSSSLSRLHLVPLCALEVETLFDLSRSDGKLDIGLGNINVFLLQIA